MNAVATNDELARLIEAYVPHCAGEVRHQQTIREFVAAHEKPFSRTHMHGHLTASALVVNESATHVLLGFHRKLGMWLQFGGHGEEGELDPLQVALREVEEESGLVSVKLHPQSPQPFDLDVHQIPQHKEVPPHLHLDIRFLVVAPNDAHLQAQAEEQEQVRWFTWDETAELPLDDSLRRMISKAKALASSAAPANSEFTS